MIIVLEIKWTDLTDLRRTRREVTIPYTDTRRGERFLSLSPPRCINRVVTGLHLSVNAPVQNMLSRDVKRLSFRCQTLKFSRPNVKCSA